MKSFTRPVQEVQFTFGFTDSLYSLNQDVSAPFQRQVLECVMIFEDLRVLDLRQINIRVSTLLHFCFGNGRINHVNFFGP